MKILRNNEQDIAIVDPSKGFGEQGQYRRESFVGWGQRQATLCLARESKNEVRHYFKNLITGTGEQIASQVIVTEIPPGHIQPFHTHEKLHEMTWVVSGTIFAIDSETLTEADRNLIFESGHLLNPGDMVIEDPGVRHTIANLYTDTYAVLLTIQTARIPLEEFPKDWKR